MTDTILLVDQAEENRNLLRLLLDKDRFQVTEAHSGQEALECLRTRIPALIILDIVISDMDGFTLFRRLKEDARLAEVPVIFYSSVDSPMAKVRGLQLGAVDYFTMPFDQGEVLARVSNQIKIGRLTSNLRAANRNLREKQERLDDDLNAAAQIQQSLLPKEIPKFSTADLAWCFLPCERIGGDIFNVCQYDDSCLAIYMLDVCGHGVPAAMVTVSISQTLSPAMRYTVRKEGGRKFIASPAEIFRFLEQEYPMSRFGRYFTMSYILFDLASGRLRFSNAGHPFPVVVRKNGEIKLLEEGGSPIGWGTGLDFEEGEAKLEAGDRLYLYTDGVVEYFNGAGQPFGMGNLCEKLAATRQQGVREACGSVMRSLAIFGEGRDPDDDITLLGLEYHGGDMEIHSRRKYFFS